MHYHIDPLENSTKYNKIFDPEPYLEIFYKEYYKRYPNGGPTISSFCNFDKTILLGLSRNKMGHFRGNKKRRRNRSFYIF